jgi:hypothetical protein
MGQGARVMGVFNGIFFRGNDLCFEGDPIPYDTNTEFDA